MKKLFMIFAGLISLGFSNSASAESVSGSLGYRHDYISGKTKVFQGDLVIGSTSVPLGAGFSVDHWFAYDLAGKEFFERDWSLVKKFYFSGGDVAVSTSANLYSFGEGYGDFAERGDAASIEANVSTSIMEGVSLFGGAETITIVSCPSDFTTAYAGVKLQAGDLYLKPRFQVQTNDSPYLRIDLGGSIDAGNGISVDPSVRLVVAEDRQPMAQADVKICF